MRDWIKRTLMLSAVMAAFTLTAGGAWAEESWNAYDDFSLASNPNGVWSYGRRATVASTDLTPSTQTDATNFSAIAGLAGWFPDSADGGLYWHPGQFINPTSSPITIASTLFLSERFFLHPDYPSASKPISVLRFTAPEAGDYDIDAVFGGRSPSTTVTVYVVNTAGSVLFSGGIVGRSELSTTGSQSYQSTVSMAAGDTLDFLVATINHPFSDTTGLDLTITSSNEAPVADAGQNVSVDSEDQSSTVITGTATDSDGDTLVCRWLEGSTVLAGPTTLTSSSCALDLSTLSTLSVGDHTLTLEIDDGSATVTDDMVLTIDNSPPTAAPSGAGVYELGSGSVVTLGGQVADFDGDTLTYVWREAGSATAISSGTIATTAGGTPVALSTVTIGTTTLGLGVHTIELEVDDGKNAAVVSSIEVQVTDTTAPTLSLSCSSTILWPPNHNMVDVTVATNPEDDGGAVTVTVSVTSNEPVNGLGDGDTGPDWDEVSVNSTTGAVSLELRAERSGKGQGRVYTIWIIATDTSGNASTASCEVRVPKSKGKN